MACFFRTVDRNNATTLPTVYEIPTECDTQSQNGNCRTEAANLANSDCKTCGSADTGELLEGIEPCKMIVDGKEIHNILITAHQMSNYQATGKGPVGCDQGTMWKISCDSDTIVQQVLTCIMDLINLDNLENEKPILYKIPEKCGDEQVDYSQAGKGNCKMEKVLDGNCGTCGVAGGGNNGLVTQSPFSSIPSGKNQKMARLCMQCDDSVDYRRSPEESRRICATKKEKLERTFCSEAVKDAADCKGLRKVEYGISDYCKPANARRLSAGTGVDHEFRMLFDQDSAELPMGQSECDVIQQSLGATRCEFGTMDSGGKFAPYVAIDPLTGTEVSANGDIGGLSPLAFGLIIAGVAILLIAAAFGIWYLIRNKQNPQEEGGNIGAQERRVYVANANNDELV